MPQVLYNDIEGFYEDISCVARQKGNCITLMGEFSLKVGTRVTIWWKIKGYGK